MTWVFVRVADGLGVQVGVAVKNRVEVREGMAVVGRVWVTVSVGGNGVRVGSTGVSVRVGEAVALGATGVELFIVPGRVLVGDGVGKKTPVITKSDPCGPLSS